MEIYKNGNDIYQVVRTLHVSTFDPRRYGVNRNDEHSYMMIRQLWRDEHHCDHVLKKGDHFMLCRTIKDVEIIQ